MPRRLQKIVLLVVVPALGLITLAAVGLPALLSPSPGVPSVADRRAPALSGIVYVAADGAIQRWDAATGQAGLVVAAAPGGRRLLAATDDGAALAYVQTAPAGTPAPSGQSGPAYSLHVWRAGFAPRTLPISEGSADQLEAAFLNSGSLAVLMEASLRLSGPLYLGDLDAGQMRRVTAQTDSFAVAPGTLVYAERLPMPTLPVQARPVVDRGLLGIYQPSGGGASSLVISAALASRRTAAVQIAYLPTPGVFAFPLWQYTADNAGTQLHLRAFRPDTPGAVADLPLQTAHEEARLNFSPDGHYLIYGGVIRRSAQGEFILESRGDRDWRIATLDWTAGGPQIIADHPFALPGDLLPSGLDWVPGGSLLAVSGIRVLTDTVRGTALTQAGTPAVLLYDAATGTLDPVLEGQAAIALLTLPDGRVLFGGATAGGPSLLLAAPANNGSRQTRPLGAVFPGGVGFACLGLLPDGAALIASYEPAWSATATRSLYRVPFDGTPRQIIAAADSPLPLRGPGR